MTDLIRRDDAIRALNGSCSNWEDDAKVQEIIMALPSAEAKQVTGKLKNHCDSLLKDDSDERKEQKSKLDLIRREDAIDAIDDAIDADSPQWAILRTKIGFLPSAEADIPKVVRVDYSPYRIKTTAPSAEGGDAETNPIPEGTGLMQPSPNNGADLISRADAIEAVRMSEHRITIADEQGGVGTVKWDMWGVYTAEAVEAIKALPSAEAVSREEYDHLEALYDAVRIYDSEADATCATCADRALCIMSAPDGNWKACKDYRPSAEAVQGEWKPFDLTWGRNVYFCTACQESTEVPTVNGQPSYNFCPNCGARMKGGDDE